MYEVSVEAVFTASHRVRAASGELEPRHTHDWCVTATLAGPELDQAGMLVDFTEAERRLRETVASLHGADLNACPMLDDLNPSAEQVAKTIYDIMVRDPALRGLLRRVRVTEAPGCAACYIAPPGA